MSVTKEKVVDQLMHLQKLLSRYQMQNFISFGPLGNPHRGQGRVLAILKMKPGISQKELTYLLNMSKQSLAELLYKLERKGYITKELSEGDKRSFIIKLTEKGEAASENIDDEQRDLVELFDVLSDEELLNLSQYLEKIILKLEEKFPEDFDMSRENLKNFIKIRKKYFHEHDHDRDRHGFREYGRRNTVFDLDDNIDIDIDIDVDED